MTNAVDLATRLNATTAGNLAKNGITHVGRYLSDSSWKGLHTDEVAAIKAAGMNIFSIYENGGNLASHFTVSQGTADAKAAYQFAQALGQPTGTAIYFTVDYDAPSSDFPKIQEYFNAVTVAMGKDYYIGAYGSFGVIKYLHDNGVCDYYFQTVAWSGGQHNNFLHIYQYQCDKTFAGLNVDFVNMEQDAIGSWGTHVESAPQPAAPAAPSNNQNYFVIAGDTLGTIAAKFGTTVDAIAKLNNISNPNNIFVGQALNIPVVTKVDAASTTKPSGPVSKLVMWNGMELKKGQIGLVHILKPIRLWTRDDKCLLHYVRGLNPGQQFPVYGKDDKYGGQFDLGENLWLTNMAGYVTYEAVPQSLLNQMK